MKSYATVKLYKIYLETVLYSIQMLTIMTDVIVKPASLRTWIDLGIPCCGSAKPDFTKLSSNLHACSMACVHATEAKAQILMCACINT